MNSPASLPDVFIVPIQDKYLVYAPRHGFSALVNRAAAQTVRMGLLGRASPEGEVGAITEELLRPGAPAPAIRSGPLRDPLFLGLIPSRGCNLNCLYCDFAAPKGNSPVMDPEIARNAIDAYIELVRSTGRTQLDIHFFGGEPFYAWETVFFAVEYARLRAAELGLSTRFEAITNGLFTEAQGCWIADHFDTVVLSLDGPGSIQEHHRPAVNGRPTFPRIAHNAHLLSDGSADLALRACITRQTAPLMPAIARWMAAEFRPATVCFEMLTVSPRTEVSGLEPPEPLEFVRSFIAARQILADYGIETVFSTADLSTCQASFCPVGKDALIVSPNGSLAACYLLEESWLKNGLDLSLGWVGQGQFQIDPNALQRVRGLVGQYKSSCQDCLCQYHCAGGCHVRRAALTEGRPYREVCFTTRLITITALLEMQGQTALVHQWLKDGAAVSKAAYQPSDRLGSSEMVL